jgi:hypothetical protein
MVLFNWDELKHRPRVHGKYIHDKPPVEHTINIGDVSFTLTVGVIFRTHFHVLSNPEVQGQRCSRCTYLGVDCYMPLPSFGMSCSQCKAKHTRCVRAPPDIREMYRQPGQCC